MTANKKRVLDEGLLGFIVSNVIFEMFGFGPSQSICGPFAAQVLAEAAAVNFEMKPP